MCGKVPLEDPEQEYLSGAALHYPRVSTLCLTNARTMSLPSADQVSGSTPEGSEGFRE